MKFTQSPTILTDGLEVKTHGTTNIPFAIYEGNIPNYLSSYPLHYHNELELIYCTAGIGKITIQGIAYELYEGDLMIILPQQVHGIEALQNHFEYYNVLFQFSLLAEECSSDPVYEQYFAPLEDGLLSVPPVIKQGSPESEQLSRYLLPLLDEDKIGTLLRIKSNLFGIMDVLSSLAIPATPLSASSHKANQLLRHAISYINHHYTEKITVSEMASCCGYSESHFMKRFREMAGISFSQYLIQLRLEKSTTLLRTSDLSLLEIALACGFSNASHFTRTFERQYHMVPSKYRLQYNSSASSKSNEI